MHAEESDVISRARRHLTPADWTEIDAAFANNGDPLLGEGARTSFRELFRRIVTLPRLRLASGRSADASVAESRTTPRVRMPRMPARSRAAQS